MLCAPLPRMQFFFVSFFMHVERKYTSNENIFIITLIKFFYKKQGTKQIYHFSGTTLNFSTAKNRSANPAQ